MRHVEIDEIGGSARRRRPRTLGVALTALVVLQAVTIPMAVHAQSFGGGISVFVPWDMFEGETGSISFENSLETSFGIGRFVSFPIGVVYNQVYGLSPEATLGDASIDPGADLATNGPWFYADSLLPYLLAKIHLPVGPLYVDIYGGGAINYNFSTRPLYHRIARDLQEAGAFGSGPAAITDLNVETGVGAGWIAGAGAGVRMGQISVGLDVSYRHIFHDLEVSGSYIAEGQNEQPFDADDTVSDLRLLLRGFSIGIGGSFALD